MSGKLTLMIGGLILGMVLIFAFIGAKSIFGSNTPKPLATSGWEPPAVTYSPGNIPTIDANDGKMASSHQDVAPPTDEHLKPELVNEPPAPDSGPDLEKPAAVTPAVDEPPATTVALADEANPEQAAVQPEPVETPAALQAPVTATTGQLEIVTQTAENGRMLKASVYVQRPNGTQIDKSSNAAKSTFTLKPGTYKITARAEGYASLTRTITVPAHAVVNQIFPLPNIAFAPPEPARTAPVPMQAQADPAPANPIAEEAHWHRHHHRDTENAGIGKLRVVALSADDGSPLPVDFTIRRQDGSIIERMNHVAMSELNLPAQEVIASFNFYGLQGEQPLVVQPGQTTSHTFNIRGVPHSAALPPQPQQPMSPEDMIRQRIQEEILRRIH
jgi:hypothetical protein